MRVVEFIDCRASRRTNLVPTMIFNPACSIRGEIGVLLKRYRELNGAKYDIERIGFYGSASRNEMNEESDIDVVVELTEPDLFSLIGIKQDLETELKCHVDIVIYRKNMNQLIPFLNFDKTMGRPPGDRPITINLKTSCVYSQQ